MPERHLPVRPDLPQLKNQAKDLLRAVRCGDASAIAEFREFHPEKIDPAGATLADVQFVLARSYQVPSWPRLVQACNLVDAIWRDDLESIRDDRPGLQQHFMVPQPRATRRSRAGPRR